MVYWQHYSTTKRLKVKVNGFFFFSMVDWIKFKQSATYNQKMSNTNNRRLVNWNSLWFDTMQQLKFDHLLDSKQNSRSNLLPNPKLMFHCSMLRLTRPKHYRRVYYYSVLCKRTPRWNAFLFVLPWIFFVEKLTRAFETEIVKKNW